VITFYWYLLRFSAEIIKQKLIKTLNFKRKFVESLLKRCQNGILGASLETAAAACCSHVIFASCSIIGRI
jgi:hypothetical protein